MKQNLRSEVLIRMIADGLLLTISVCIGSLILFLFKRIDVPAMGWFVFRTASLLILLGVPIMFAFGVYTRTRGYRVRYKVVYVLRALVATFAAFVVVDQILPGKPLPLYAAGVAFAFSATSIVTARIWANIWLYMTLKEEHRHPRLKAQRCSRNILLIGGAGYIGSALLPKLLDAGYRVRLLDSFVYGMEPISDCLGNPNLEIVQADFRQVDKVVQAMQDIGTVIHLGAIVGDPACALNEELTIEVNLIATRMIAEVAKGQGVSRFVFASTCSVYGASDQILDERSALNPVSLYARSKIACEEVIRQLAGAHFQPVILRFGTIYGLSGRTRFDLVVNLLAAKALVDGEITVFGPSQWRPFLHVADAANAVLLATEAPSPRLQHVTFNVGSDEQNLTLLQVGKLIKKMVPTAVIKCTEQNVDRRNYRVNFSRIRENLKFRPEWTIEDGVTQVLDAIRSGTVVDYRAPRYSNVKYLSEEDTKAKLTVQNGWAKDMVDAWEPRPSPGNGRAAAYN